MGRMLSRWILALAAGACAACGGAPQGGSSTPDKETTVKLADRLQSETATGSTLTEFQKKRLLGHYSTHDGATGVILDRTVTPHRAKLDGVDKVVTLEESHGPYSTKEYRSTDPPMWFRIGEDGDVQLFQGPKQTSGVRVVRDADANPLK